MRTTFSGAVFCVADNIFGHFFEDVLISAGNVLRIRVIQQAFGKVLVFNHEQKLQFGVHGRSDGGRIIDCLQGMVGAVNGNKNFINHFISLYFII